MEPFMINQIEKINKIDHDNETMLLDIKKIKNSIFEKMDLLEKEKLKNLRLRNKVKDLENKIRTLNLTLYDKTWEIEKMKDNFT